MADNSIVMICTTKTSLCKSYPNRYQGCNLYGLQVLLGKVVLRSKSQGF